MSSKGVGSKGVCKLFKTAQEEGLLSAKSIQALNVVDIGAKIQAGLGISVDDVTASDVVLVTQMIDDSGSISGCNNEKHVRDGHNLALEALINSKQKDSILALTRYLNGLVLFPYRPIEQAIKMDSKNYIACGGTPLYDEIIVLLGTVLAKSQEFANNGVPVRTITLITTDGRDEHSKKSKPKDVATVIKDMLKSESHIIAAMGIDDGETNFREVFAEMGVLEKWILTPKNTPSEIRKAFMVFSQSAVRASQGAASFSKTALGGFATP